MTEIPVPADPRRQPETDTAVTDSPVTDSPVTDTAEIERTPDSAGGPTPETGDLVVDAALADLAAVDSSNLDAVLAAGESVHATLTSRLSDLGS